MCSSHESTTFLKGSASRPVADRSAELPRKRAGRRDAGASWETVYFIVFTENPGKPLESDRCVSYGTNLTFPGVCPYLLAHLVTFILLNENMKARSCQWNRFKDNIRSLDAINYLNKAQVQISTGLQDENQFLVPSSWSALLWDEGRKGCPSPSTCSCSKGPASPRRSVHLLIVLSFLIFHSLFFVPFSFPNS